MTTFLYRVLHDLPLTLWGDGSITRDYFFVADVVTALLTAAAANDLTNHVFNLGGGDEISLNQLVSAVETTVGKPARLVHQPPRAFDVPRLLLDTTQAQRLLNWSAQTSLPERLHKTLTWLQTYPPPDEK